MPLSRRALVVATLFGMPIPSAGAAELAMLRPQVASAIGLVALSQDRVAFRAAGLDPAIELPAQRARLVALLPIAGRQVALLAFGAELPGSWPRLDLGAVVGWDGACLRVLALEVLGWRAANGAWLASRFAGTADRRRLRMTREAAAPRGPRPWRREQWIDLLAWREGAALADAPLRPPAAGTWQARLAALRAPVAARLAAPCRDISEDLIRLLPPDSLPPR